MTIKKTYLRQLKYQITREDYTALRTCLSVRGEERGSRHIHTMQFVSYRDLASAKPVEDTAILEQDRTRFSLHYFDDDPTFLLLERREDGQQTSAMVTEAECRALLAGETDWLLNRHDPLLQDFHDSLTEHMLLPQMLLTYQREVYTADDLDLWVALDTDIRSSLDHMDFLDPQQLERVTTGQENRILMEISYSDHIPDDVLCLLEETAPRRRLLKGSFKPTQIRF